MIIGLAFNFLAPRYLGSIGTTVVGKQSKEKMQKQLRKPLTTQEKTYSQF